MPMGHSVGWIVADPLGHQCPPSRRGSGSLFEMDVYFCCREGAAVVEAGASTTYDEFTQQETGWHVIEGAGPLHDASAVYGVAWGLGLVARPARERRCRRGDRWQGGRHVASIPDGRGLQEPWAPCTPSEGGAPTPWRRLETAIATCGPVARAGEPAAWTRLNGTRVAPARSIRWIVSTGLQAAFAACTSRGASASGRPRRSPRVGPRAPGRCGYAGATEGSGNSGSAESTSSSRINAFPAGTRRAAGRRSQLQDLGPVRAVDPHNSHGSGEGGRIGGQERRPESGGTASCWAASPGDDPHASSSSTDHLMGGGGGDQAQLACGPEEQLGRAGVGQHRGGAGGEEALGAPFTVSAQHVQPVQDPMDPLPGDLTAVQLDNGGGIEDGGGISCAGAVGPLCPGSAAQLYASKRRSMQRLNVQRSTVNGNGEFCEFWFLTCTAGPSPQPAPSALNPRHRPSPSALNPRHQPSARALALSPQPNLSLTHCFTHTTLSDCTSTLPRSANTRDVLYSHAVCVSGGGGRGGAQAQPTRDGHDLQGVLSPRHWEGHDRVADRDGNSAHRRGVEHDHAPALVLQGAIDALEGDNETAPRCCRHRRRRLGKPPPAVAGAGTPSTIPAGAGMRFVQCGNAAVPASALVWFWRSGGEPGSQRSQLRWQGSGIPFGVALAWTGYPQGLDRGLARGHGHGHGRGHGHGHDPEARGAGLRSKADANEAPVMQEVAGFGPGKTQKVNQGTICGVPMMRSKQDVMKQQSGKMVWQASSGGEAISMGNADKADACGREGGAAQLRHGKWRNKVDAGGDAFPMECRVLEHSGRVCSFFSQNSFCCATVVSCCNLLVRYIVSLQPAPSALSTSPLAFSHALNAPKTKKNKKTQDTKNMGCEHGRSVPQNCVPRAQKAVSGRNGGYLETVEPLCWHTPENSSFWGRTLGSLNGPLARFLAPIGNLEDRPKAEF
eukprot:gene5418-biopygen8745